MSTLNQLLARGINTKKHRRWCRRCNRYTYHGHTIGCLVCTAIEPAEPKKQPVHVTVKDSTWFRGRRIELEITHEVDGGPVRVDGLLVPKGRLLFTIHSFRPCVVYVRGRSYFLGDRNEANK